MILLYILLILLGAFPLVLTAIRMRKAAKIKKEGIHTNGTIQHIRNIRMPRGGSVDVIRIEYKDRTTSKSYTAKATVSPGKYRIGDAFEVIYLPDQPAKYAIDTKGGYLMILIFSIILFLFILFAVYKLNEMTASGQM